MLADLTHCIRIQIQFPFGDELARFDLTLNPNIRPNLTSSVDPELLKLIKTGGVNLVKQFPSILVFVIPKSQLQPPKTDILF